MNFKDWNFLDYKIIAGNDLKHIAIVLGVVLLALVAAKIIKVQLKKLSDGYEKKGRITLSLILNAFAQTAVILSLFIGLKISLGFLEFGGKDSSAKEIVETLISVGFASTLGWFFYRLVDVPIHFLELAASKSKSRMDDMLVPLVRKSLRLVIAGLTLIQIVQIFSGKEIGTILASLGIGGLAVALAAQDTIKNFFGSVVVLMDKPFEIGDRINLDNHDGIVEEVGLRSTRVRRLDGHLVTFPNGEIANKAIWNIAKRPYIRNLFYINITYSTPPEKVKEAKQIVEALLENHEGVNEEFPPRVYFEKFSESSLDLLVIYWYHPPDYWAYMDFTNNLNMQILEKFNAAGIDFAFPSRSLYLNHEKSEDSQKGSHEFRKDLI